MDTYHTPRKNLMFSLLLSFAIVNAAETNSVVRIDRSSPFDYNFAAVHAEIPLFRPPQKKLDAGQEFQFTFECQSSIPARICTMAENGFKNAGNRIAQVLNIRQPIRVRATFQNLCQGQADCTILGAAAAASEFPVKMDGVTVMVPQALVKQVNTDGPVPFRDVDVLSTFNSEIGWYFRDDPTTAGRQQFDFELVAAHEIMHGLGFASGLVDLSSIEDLRQLTQFRDSFLTTSLYFETDDVTTRTPVSTLKPLNVFDFFVKGPSDSYVDLYRRMDAFPKRKRTIGAFLTEFQRSGDPFDAARTAFRVASAGIGRLTFNPPNGNPIVLFSPTRFSQGSSGSHLDLVANATANFLMVPALSPGRTIEQLIESNRATSFFGPDIAAIFEAIGWPMKANPNAPLKTLVIDREFGKSDSIGHRVSLGVILTSLLILC
jgi:hypothetical protein